jgi:hypothetical protein
MDEVDQVVVERLIRGRYQFLSASFEERCAAIDLLDTGELGAGGIATKLGCSDRTVQRRRAQRRKAEGGGS